MDQWEKNVSADDAGGQGAFVVNRRQRALEEAQLRADEFIDRENSIAVKKDRFQRKEICKRSLKERYREKQERRIPRMVLW